VRLSNEPAVHLYVFSGYQKISIWKKYYQDGEDALVMEKQLTGV
jgi:ribosomal protein S18 acetylase RimI-like enzyme